MNALAPGSSIVENPLQSNHTRATFNCLQSLGVHLLWDAPNKRLLIDSPGFARFHQPNDVLDVENSDTTLRLLTGVLAGSQLEAVFDGDSQTRLRQMKRLFDAIAIMGGNIQSIDKTYDVPFRVIGGQLRGIEYELPSSDSRLKSALMLAALNAKGKTLIHVKQNSRDHTERLFKTFQIPFVWDGEIIEIEPYMLREPISSYTVYGDPSSAAALVTLAVLFKQPLVIRDLYLNPTRIGYYETLKLMGADINFVVEKRVCNEPVGRLEVGPGKELRGVELKYQDLYDMIDEIPLLSLVCTQAEGKSVLDGLIEMRYRENNRLVCTSQLLNSMGAQTRYFHETLVIEGPRRLCGERTLNTLGDHRMAILSVIASFLNPDAVVVNNVEAIDFSFPTFFELLASLVQPQCWKIAE